MKRQIIAIGGGGFGRNPGEGIIENYILNQANNKNPKICFIPTATGDNEAAAAQISSSAFYAKYAVDAFTIGAQMNESDSDTANADEDFTAYSVSYQVNDDFSVSYGLAEVDYENSTKESQESSGVSFSYTSGGMTLSGSHNSTDNVAGTSANDRSGYELNLKFAF